MFTLMDDAIFTNNDIAGNTFTLTLNGLDVGTPYRVQFLMGDQIGNRNMRIESGTASSGNFAASPNHRFLFANFTADLATQSFAFIPVNDVVADKPCVSQRHCNFCDSRAVMVGSMWYRSLRYDG